ncbi:MAG: hypothetical protein PHN64_10730 [Desulfovibrionaceae bacterium]|nr:hypothetical protein [Desulfovibrionaceae bacterium]
MVQIYLKIASPAVLHRAELFSLGGLTALPALVTSQKCRNHAVR